MLPGSIYVWVVLSGLSSVCKISLAVHRPQLEKHHIPF